MAATDTYAGRGTIPQNVKIYFRSKGGKKFQWGIIKDPYRNTNMSLFELNPQEGVNRNGFLSKMTKIGKIGAKFNRAPISTDSMNEFDNFSVNR